MEEMFEKLKEIICHYVEVEPEEITLEARFVEDLDLNSYDLMCMIGEIEEDFQIEVDEQKAAKLLTVQDAVTYFSSLRN